MAGISRLDEQVPQGRQFRDGVEVPASATQEVVDAETVMYAANTAMPTPTTSYGVPQSIYGEGHDTYITSADLEVPGIFDNDYGAPSLPADTSDIPLWPGPEVSERQDVDEEPADAGTQYGEPDHGADEKEQSVSADGILPEIGRHAWSESDQAVAAWWRGRVVERASQLESVSEEDAVALADGLVADYAHIYGATVVAQDQNMTSATRKQLKAELGDDYLPQLMALDAMLKDPTIFEDGAGEYLVLARVDGQRVLNIAPVARGLMKLASRSGRYIAEETADDTEELNSLTLLMNENIDQFRYGRWRHTNMTPSDRMLEIRRKQGAA